MVENWCRAVGGDGGGEGTRVARKVDNRHQTIAEWEDAPDTLNTGSQSDR